METKRRRKYNKQSICRLIKPMLWFLFSAVPIEKILPWRISNRIKITAGPFGVFHISQNRYPRTEEEKYKRFSRKQNFLRAHFHVEIITVKKSRKKPRAPMNYYYYWYTLTCYFILRLCDLLLATRLEYRQGTRRMQLKSLFL